MADKYLGTGRALNLCKIHVLARDEEPGGPQHFAAFVLAPARTDEGSRYTVDEAAALEVFREYVENTGDGYVDPASIIGVEDLGTIEEGLSEPTLEGRFLLWGYPGEGMELVTPEILAVYEEYYGMVHRAEDLDLNAIEQAYKEAWDDFFEKAKIRYQEVMASRIDLWKREEARRQRLYNPEV